MRLALGLLFGFILGWIGIAAAALAIDEMMTVSQREGAFAMGAIFVIGPVGGVVGAVLQHHPITLNPCDRISCCRINCL